MNICPSGKGFLMWGPHSQGSGVVMIDGDDRSDANEDSHSEHLLIPCSMSLHAKCFVNIKAVLSS